MGSPCRTGRGRSLQAAVEAELGRLLAEGGLAAGLAQGGAVPGLAGGSIQLGQENEPGAPGPADRPGGLWRNRDAGTSDPGQVIADIWGAHDGRAGVAEGKQSADQGA